MTERRSDAGCIFPGAARADTTTMSIPDNLDPQDARYFKLLEGRAVGHTEEQIAKELGFDSPHALYKQLQQDRFPLCACGVLRPNPDHMCAVRADGCRKLWNQRTALRLMGALEDRYKILTNLARDWLRELVLEWHQDGLSVALGDRKEDTDGSFPPGVPNQSEERRVRLEGGQRITILLGEGSDDPRQDGRSIPLATVWDAVPRAHKAMLAMLAAAEGAELRRKNDLRQKDLERLRKNLVNSEQSSISHSEHRLIAFARLLLSWRRPGFNADTDEGRELLAKTADKVARVAETARQLEDWLEFGNLEGDTRREVETAQQDLYAAEPKNFTGMTWPEVAEKLGFMDPHKRPDKRRAAAQRAKTSAERGEKLYIAALGSVEAWEEYKTAQSRRYRQK